MKILYLIDSLDVGGAETLLVNTVNELCIQSDWNITVATTQKASGKLRQKLNPLITYQHFDCTGFNFLKGILALRKFVKINKIDLLHAHLYNSIIISRLVQKVNGKLLATYHNLDFDPSSVYYSRWRVLLDKISFRKGSVSIYVSEAVKNSVERVRNGKSVFYVLPNFADKKFTPAYHYNDTPCLRIIAIGNLKAVKNFSFIIQAMKHVKGQPIKVDIYGEGPLFQELFDQIAVEKLPISLKGKTTITPELFATYDVFLMTSKNEGMPISLLEAISVGMPSLLPDHLQVMNEVAKNAALYFSIDDEKSLSQQLLGLLSNKSRLKTMSAAAIKRSQFYSLQNHLGSLQSIYLKFRS